MTTKLKFRALETEFKTKSVEGVKGELKDFTEFEKDFIGYLYNVYQIANKEGATAGQVNSVISDTSYMNKHKLGFKENADAQRKFAREQAISFLSMTLSPKKLKEIGWIAKETDAKEYKKPGPLFVDGRSEQNAFFSNRSEIASKQAGKFVPLYVSALEPSFTDKLKDKKLNSSVTSMADMIVLVSKKAKLLDDIGLSISVFGFAASAAMLISIPLFIMGSLPGLICVGIALGLLAVSVALFITHKVIEDIIKDDFAKDKGGISAELSKAKAEGVIMEKRPLISYQTEKKGIDSPIKPSLGVSLAQFIPLISSVDKTYVRI